MRRVQIILFVLSVSMFAAVARAQVMTGTPPYGSFSGGPFDIVNNGNLNVHFAIPVEHKAGRGLAFNYDLTYDSSVWYPVTSGTTTTWEPVQNWGWSNWAEGQAGTVYFDRVTYFDCPFTICGYSGCYTGYNATETVLSDFIYYDKQGVAHFFPGQNVSWSGPGGQGCSMGQNSYDNPAYATDGSGYILDGENWTVTDPTGKVSHPPVQQFTGAASMSDANGNSISNTSAGVFTDTLGVTALAIGGGGTPSSPTTFEYTGAGGTATVTVNYTAYTVATNFGVPGVGEFGATAENLISSIVLPDGETYTFTYEATPATPSAGACTPLSGTYSANCVTARIAKVTLPTVGSITYSYTGGNNGIFSDGSAAGLTRTVTPGGNEQPGTWTYTRNNVSPPSTEWTTTLTDPASKSTTYYFQSVTPSGSTATAFYETERDLPGGLGTVYTCYGGNTKPCNNTAISALTHRTVWTEMGSATSEVDTIYDDYGAPTEVDEYDWGGATPVRKTSATYDSGQNCGVTNPNVLNLPCTVTVKDGSNNVVSSTTYQYDQNGNLLTKSSGGLTDTFQWNSNGTLQWSKDAGGNKTTYDYTGSSCSAFPTTITPPVSSLATTATWDCNGAVMLSSTDANGQETDFGYDTMNRMTSTSYKDNQGNSLGSVGTAYSTNSITVTSTGIGNAGGQQQDTTTLDGLGRPIAQVKAGVETDTSYDSMGRVSTVSISGSGASDTYQYDALSRVTTITHADGNDVSTDWTTNPQCPKTTDEAGNPRTVCYDALGRITSVKDALGNTTSYSYDALNDLTTVTQGAQTRTYHYDSLGRLTSAATPELNGCAVTYNYNSTGELSSRVAPEENQANCTTTVTTTYSYDTMHRLISKTYNDGVTPEANYFYGDTPPGSWPAWTGVSFGNYAKGRMVLACTGSSAGNCSSPQTAVAFNYDPMGHVASLWQCTPLNCGNSSIWQLSYSSDFAGDLLTYTIPEGGGYTVTNNVNANQQITGVTSGKSDSYHPGTLATMTYYSWGGLKTLEDGCVPAGSCTNTVETYQYNSRLQPTVMELGTSSNNTADYCLVYDYYSSTPPTSCADPGASGVDNGNVKSYRYQDGVNTSMSHTASYTYDSLNRLTGETAKDFNSNPIWTNAYTYDQYGNFLCGPGSLNGVCLAYSPDSSSNRMTQVAGSTQSYDAAGDMYQSVDSNGALNYQYDAEGRMISAQMSNGNTETLVYNALGEQVRESVPAMNVEEIWDAFGRMAGSYNSTGWKNGGTPYWWPQFMRVDGRIFAYDTCCGNQDMFLHKDALGTTRMVTRYDGMLVEDIVHYPWGGIESLTGGSYDRAFAGFTRASQFTEHMPTLNRQYYMTQGRWMTPDPSGMASVSLTDPQTWNMYAYVTNNPATLTDPTGLDGIYTLPSSDPCANAPSPHAAACEAQYAEGIAEAYANNSGSCMYGEHGCAGGENDNAIAEGIFANQMNIQFLSGCVKYGKCSQSDSYTIEGTTYSYLEPTNVGSKINGVSYGSTTTPGQWDATSSPDFYQLTVNLGALAGVQLSLTEDRYGQWYFGLGPEFGKSATGVSGSWAGGRMVGYSGYTPSPGDMQNFLTNWGCSAGAGAGPYFAFAWSGGGQAWEAGFSTPQVGVGCSYTWRVP